MDKEEYLKILLKQIQNKTARKMVEKEISAHIDDQAEAYVIGGLDESEAVLCAVKDMGDPKTVGKDLNQLHKPETPWTMLFLMVIVTFVSIFTQYMLIFGFNGCLGLDSVKSVEPLYIKWICILIFGIMFMFAAFFTNYSKLEKHIKLLGVIVLALNVFFSYVIRLSIDQSVILLLYAPVYGGIVYSYRGSEKAALCKIYIWMIVPFLLFSPVANPIYLIFLFVSEAVVLSYAISINVIEFADSKMKIISRVIMVIPILIYFAYLFFPMGSAMMENARNTFGLNNIDCQMYAIKDMWSSAEVFRGNNNLYLDRLLNLGANSFMDYALVGLAMRFGKLTALLLFVIIALTVPLSANMIIKQKNALGSLVGIGIISVISVMLISGLLMNMGIIPISTLGIPYISYGGLAVIINYIYAGIIMSVYRYQKIIVPDKEIA